MNESCLHELERIYGTLKGAEKRVGDYILRNTREVIHLSITEIAVKCGSGEATVVRFCKRLGCKGFQDLKIKIASEIVSPLDDIHEEVRENDDPLILMRKVFQSNIYSLGKTLELAEPDDLRRAIDIASDSERLAFFGMGGSASVAQDACHKFLRTGKRCEFFADSHYEAMTAALYTDRDCIVAVSDSGSNKELVCNMEIAKKNSVRIIAVTSNKQSPLSKVSDIVLQSFGLEHRIKSEAMSSRLSALSLLDCLYVGVCLKSRDAYYESVRKIRNAISEKRY